MNTPAAYTGCWIWSDPYLNKIASKNSRADSVPSRRSGQSSIRTREDPDGVCPRGAPRGQTRARPPGAQRGPDASRTAMATALLCPTGTISRLPRATQIWRASARASCGPTIEPDEQLDHPCGLRPTRCRVYSPRFDAAAIHRTWVRSMPNWQAIAAGPTPAASAARTIFSCPGVSDRDPARFRARPPGAVPDASFGSRRRSARAVFQPRLSASALAARSGASSWPSSRWRSEPARSPGRARCGRSPMPWGDPGGPNGCPRGRSAGFAASAGGCGGSGASAGCGPRHRTASCRDAGEPPPACRSRHGRRGPEGSTACRRRR